MIHCLNGNLLRALIGFGRLEDERVQWAIDWQARAITGEGYSRYSHSGTSGPGFCCAANEHLPCAWGAIKGLLALARIPAERRAPHVERAIQQGVAFLFSCDPATAAYPAGRGKGKPSPFWFKLGFPLGYLADILQNLTVLCELGFAKDARLEGAVQWLLSQQEPSGGFRNWSASTGKTWVKIDKQGQLSKWVTLRACSVLKVSPTSSTPVPGQPEKASSIISPAISCCSSARFASRRTCACCSMNVMAHTLFLIALLKVAQHAGSVTAVQETSDCFLGHLQTPKCSITTSRSHHKVRGEGHKKITVAGSKLHLPFQHTLFRSPHHSKRAVRHKRDTSSRKHAQATAECRVTRL